MKTDIILGFVALRIAPALGVLTGFDKVMAVVILILFFLGLFKLVDGINNFDQPNGKLGVAQGVAIMLAPIIAFAVFASLYDGLSSVIGDPTGVEAF